MVSAGEVSPRQQSTWAKRAIGAILILCVFRTLYTALVSLELAPDEAYYWDWSRRLDWGYYSKPPMVAWLIRLATTFGGSSVFVVRLPAILLSTCGLCAAFLLASRMYDARVGFWTVVLCAASPGSAALGLLMTIDAPLLCCWSLALYALWRALERRPRRWRWLALTAIAIGMGLLSKQTMVAFLFSTCLFVISSRADWAEFRRPGLWISLIVAVAFLAPVVWWNIQHDWITLQHTSSHFALEDEGWGGRILQSGEFLASQLGVVSPVTCLVGLVAALATVAKGSRIERRERFLVCFSVVPLAGVFVLSLSRNVNANWPAPFYLSGIVLATAWMLRTTGDVHAVSAESPLTVFRVLHARMSAACAHHSRWSGMPLWFWQTSHAGNKRLLSCAGCGVLFAMATYLSPVLVPAFGLSGTRLDPFTRLRGWEELAASIDKVRSELDDSRPTFIAVTTQRQDVSELAFYLTDQPRIHLWNDSDSVTSQYDIWGGPHGVNGWDALIVAGGRQAVPASLRASFRSLTPRAQLTADLGNGRCRDYTLWVGQEFRGTRRAAQLEARPVH